MFPCYNEVFLVANDVLCGKKLRLFCEKNQCIAIIRFEPDAENKRGFLTNMHTGFLFFFAGQYLGFFFLFTLVWFYIYYI